MSFAYLYFSVERSAFALSPFTVHQFTTQQLNQYDTVSKLIAMALEALSVASSITALLQARSAIINFISLMTESSETLQKTVAEMREWDMIFHRLQNLVEKLDNSDYMSDRRGMVFCRSFSLDSCRVFRLVRQTRRNSDSNQ